MGIVRASGIRGVALVVCFGLTAGCATQNPAAKLNDGERAYREGRTSDAELIWLESLGEAEAFGEDDPRLAQSLRMLANLQIQQGRYEEARPLLERWIAIRERQGDTMDGGFADGVEALAGIHMVNRDFPRAVALYERSLEIRKSDGMLDNLAMADTLENLGRAYASVGRRQDAEAAFEQSVEIRADVLGSSDPGLAKGLHALGGFQFQRGRYAEADKLYGRALEIVAKGSQPDERFVAQLHHDAGVLSRVTGDPKTALEHLQTAQEIRTRLFGERHAETATTVSEIALAYMEERRLDEAEELLVWVIELRIDLFGTQSAPVAAALNSLALVHQYRHEYDDAASLMGRALQIRRNLPTDQNRALGALYTNLGALLKLRGDPAEATRALQQALVIQEGALERDHPEIAATLHDLADALIMQGKAAEADAHLKRALIIKERAYGEDHPRGADTLAVIGVLHASRNEFDLAEQTFERSLEIWAEHPPNDPVPLAETLSNLALIRQVQGRPAEAVALYGEAIPRFDANLGPRHPSTLRARYNEAAAFAAQGNYAVAIRRYEHLLAADAAALPPGDPHLARPLIGPPTDHYEMALFGDADAYFLRAVALLEDTEPLETRALSFAIGGHADCLVQQGHDAEAEPLYRRGIALLEGQEVTSLREIGALYANLASVEARLGRWERAEPIYAHALDILRKAYGPRHEVIARLLFERAETYQALGQHDLARISLEDALILRRELLSPDDPELAQTMNGLAVLLVQQAEYGEAEDLLQRAVAIHENNGESEGTNAVAHGQTLSVLGRLYARQDRPEDAETTLARSLNLLEPSLGQQDPLVLETRREYDLLVRARQIEGGG
jgi:tetratricopeptide (TPR) repeat protein